MTRFIIVTCMTAWVALGAFNYLGRQPTTHPATNATPTTDQATQAARDEIREDLDSMARGLSWLSAAKKMKDISPKTPAVEFDRGIVSFEGATLDDVGVATFSPAEGAAIAPFAKDTDVIFVQTQDGVLSLDLSDLGWPETSVVLTCDNTTEEGEVSTSLDEQEATITLRCRFFDTKAMVAVFYQFPGHPSVVRMLIKK